MSIFDYYFTNINFVALLSKYCSSNWFVHKHKINRRQTLPPEIYIPSYYIYNCGNIPILYRMAFHLLTKLTSKIRFVFSMTFNFDVIRTSATIYPTEWYTGVFVCVWRLCMFVRLSRRYNSTPKNKNENEIKKMDKAKWKNEMK